jgi:hypothetical protein
MIGGNKEEANMKRQSKSSKRILTSLVIAVIMLFQMAGGNHAQAIGPLPRTPIQNAPDIIVTTTSDEVDFGGLQQECDLPGSDGVVSLREDLIAANNTPGPQVIAFNVPTSRETIPN